MLAAIAISFHLASRLRRDQKVLHAWQAFVRGEAVSHDIQVLMESGLIGPIAQPKRIAELMAVDKAIHRLREFSQRIRSMLRR